MDGQQVSALGPVGNPRSAPDQRLALGAAGQSHDHTLPRFPRPCDVVAGAVAVELVVHLVRQPQHCQLAQRGEVPDPEVVAQCGIHFFRRIDIAVRHSPLKSLRRHVHQLDLIRPAHHFVGHRFMLGDAGDLLDNVVDRLQMLDVDGGDDVDAGVEQIFDVLPALLVLRSWHVGVGEFVDKRHLRGTRNHRGGVHLGERRVPVGHRLARDDFQVLEQVLCARTFVAFDIANHHVGATLAPAPGFAEHRVGLADARRRPEVDPKLAPHRTCLYVDQVYDVFLLCGELRTRVVALLGTTVARARTVSEPSNIAVQTEKWDSASTIWRPRAVWR